MQFLFIPYSTVSRVIQEFNNNPKESNNWCETIIKKANDLVVIKQIIKNYVQSTCSFFILTIFIDILIRHLMWYYKREVLSILQKKK